MIKRRKIAKVTGILFLGITVILTILIFYSQRYVMLIFLFLCRNKRILLLLSM